MSRLAAEQTELLRALTRCGVEFVVVGGIAAQVHGWQGFVEHGSTLSMRD
jgi:hypothetical protein